LSGDREGGYILIQDCFEVHLRNSLIRVGVNPNDGIVPIGAKAGAIARDPEIAAVKTANPNNDGSKWTNVIIEGSSLYGPGNRILDIGDHTVCYFRHSFSDSRHGDPKNFRVSAPNGIGDA
jgi:hypothetical protein